MVAASKQSKQSKAKVVQGTSVTAPEFAASNPANPPAEVAAPTEVTAAPAEVAAAPAAPTNAGLVVTQAKYHPRENNPKTGDKKHVWWGLATAVFTANKDKPVTVAMLLDGGLTESNVAYLLRRKRLVAA